MYLGKPVDSASDVDYIPSKFTYNSAQQSEASQRQKMERAKRLDKRRQVRDDTEMESMNQKMAAEGLLLLQEAQPEYTHDVQTQTNLTDTATQVATDVQSMSTQTSETLWFLIHVTFQIILHLRIMMMQPSFILVYHPGPYLST